MFFSLAFSVQTKTNREVQPKIGFPFIFLCSLSQLKRELVVSCCGELIALHTEIANLIVDVASVVDTETQVGNYKNEWIMNEWTNLLLTFQALDLTVLLL